MRKILTLFIILALLASSMVACGNKDGEKTPNEGIGDTAGDNNDTGSGNNNTNDNNNNNTNDNNNGGNNEGNKEEEKPELPGVDYLRNDLSEYVEIDEKYYKGYTVIVDANRVPEIDIENKIIQTLRKHKSTDPVDGDGVISVGDVVSIYYKGYYLNEDGSQNFFNGGDNTGSGKSYELEIGSGSFIPGFEYNLIGINPSEHTEENPIVVETYFPKNYQSSELAGKTAYFIVTVEKLVEYDAPELDDAFISETLKLTETALAEYKGETLTEKYRSYLFDVIADENGLSVEDLIVNAFWESAIAGAVVKQYPEKQIQEAYDSIIYEIEFYYEYYYSYYYEYDEFMCLYIGLEVGSDWKAYVREIATAQVKEQLLFYRIMHQEGLQPTDEEYAVLFDEYLTTALANNNVTLESCGSEEAYLKEKESYKNQIISQKGEDYFKSMIYYQVTMDAIKGYANIVEIG